MSLKRIDRLVRLAVLNLSDSQPTLFDFTSETNQTEWNIAHHLANELHALFNAYDCDVDVAKPHHGDRRPDIILHRRGTNARNHLVIEVKRHVADVDEDEAKIREWWFSDRLHYDFGAVVAIDKDTEPFVRAFQNEKRAKARRRRLVRRR